jgi:hypothetical protein
MAKEKSNLIKLTSNLSSFDYSNVGEPHYTDVKRDIASERGPSADANYEKLSADDGQLIQKKPGERYRGTKLDGGFLRGGAALKVERQVEDQERIGKFLTTPKGALFTIKQAILQNQNSDRETNIYNPLSLTTSLIDTLSTRPQRHIDEITSPFSSLGNFFRFLSGTNTTEQSRKNGNSISNNRDVQNLKPDVEEFGGKVGIDYTSDRADINTDNRIDVSGPNERRRTRKYIPFGDTNDKIRKEDDREIGTLFTHRAGPDIGTGQFKMPSRNLGLQEESFFSRKDGLKEEARDYKTNKENPSGDLLELPRYETSDKEDLVTNFGTDVMPSGKNVKFFGSDGKDGGRFGKKLGKQIEANQFFNIKSRGSRKLQVKYGGELTETSRIDKDTPLPDDFIKFRIRDVVNGRWIIFPAIFTSGITDNSQASYNTINYIGRPDAVHIYQNRTRNVSFGFRVVALNENDIPIIWEKMNYLKGLTLPQYKSFFSDTSRADNTRPVAPIINLTIGDMFVNTPGYFTSVSVNVGNSATWETKDGRQFPHVCDVSVEFTHIGKEVPTMLSKHYDGAERVKSIHIRRGERDKFLTEIRKKQSDTTKAFNESINNLIPKTAEEKRQAEISNDLTNQLVGGTQSSTSNTLTFDTSFGTKLTG